MRGKAVASAVPFRRCRDHPRLCGEKESVPESGIGALWITPAYAGKRYQRWSVAIVRWDHPRLCGEKAFTNNDVFRNFRITPAYAGKSKYENLYSQLKLDHPRLCGEKIEERNPSDYVLGSPPPMRGKGRKRQRSHRGSRITPAYAGKSSGKESADSVPWDHPRLCGEKSACTRVILQWTGSPPPMRGKVNILMSNKLSLRITPAYAGKSSFLRHIQTLK